MRLPRPLSVVLVAVTALVAGSAVAQAAPGSPAGLAAPSHNPIHQHGSQVSQGSPPAIHTPSRPQEK